jgi:tetratricopeptide (TPR) repeat protein
LHLKYTKGLAGLLLAFFCAQSTATDTQLLTAITLAKEGTEYRLRGDFQSAAKIEARLIEAFDHPVGHVFALNTIITHLTWDESITSMDQPLLEHTTQIMNWCEPRIEDNYNDAEAHYYCGQASFALSYFNGLRGNYFQAGRLGTRSIDHLEAALAADPDFVDAKMYLGVAYYVADNLPPFIRMFSRFLWFIPTGNSEKSLPYIRDVIEGSDHYANVARYVFSSIARSENDAVRSEIRGYLEDLVSQFPQNPRFQLQLVFQVLAAEEFESVLTASATYLDSERPPAEPHVSLIRILMVRAHMGMKQISQAEQLFEKVRPMLNSEHKELPDWSLTWFMLTDAQLHDLSQRRTQAVNIYKQIIGIARNRPVSDPILEAARSGVVRPYRPTAL